MSDVIFNFNLLHSDGILVFFANFFVLKLQWWLGVLSDHLIQVGWPMKKTSTLTTNQWKTRITISSFPYIFQIPVQLAWALSVMDPLTFILGTPISTIVALIFSQSKVCVEPSHDCMSQYTIISTLKYLLTYTCHIIVVNSFSFFTCSNMIQKFSMSPLLHAYAS